MTGGGFLSGADINKIAKKGEKIYQKIKSQFEPQEKGKYLAIETETEKVYLSDTGAKAIELAKQSHPRSIFFLVRIGFEAVHTLTQFFPPNEL
jgi:hypothetical protein